MSAQKLLIFFSAEVNGKLFPSLDQPNADLLDLLNAMSLDGANEYLSKHPLQFEWASLQLFGKNLSTADCSKILSLQELCRVMLVDVNDAVIEFLLPLRQLKSLVIKSELITDSCLPVLGQLHGLEMIDLQACPNLSASGCDLLIQHLNLDLRNCWMPVR